MITTILTVYLLEVGIEVSKAGVVVGLFSITALIMRPISGYVTDTFNQKHLMIFSTAVVTVSVVGYVLTGSLPLIVAFRILHSFAFAISSTAIVALASNYIPQSRFSGKTPQEHARYFSRIARLTVDGLTSIASPSAA